MKNRNFKKWVNILGIVILFLLIIFVLTKPKETPQTDIEVVKCISEKATLYTQLGCHACEKQENLFGENYKYLDVIDCFYTPSKCQNIMATPTWKINNNLYKGIHTIEELKELTGC